MRRCGRRPKPRLGPGRGSCFCWRVFGVPGLYLAGNLQIETVTMLGRFLAFAIVAISLDLLWGYTGILCLCQSLFFALGGYAMGMYLAMHGPLDAGIPRCLCVVSSQVHGIMLPWFWQPFEYLAAAILLGLLVPGAFGLDRRVLRLRQPGPRRLFLHSHDRRDDGRMARVLHEQYAFMRHQWAYELCHLGRLRSYRERT